MYMTKRRILFILALIIFFGALALAIFWLVLPSEYFSDKKFVALVSFLASLLLTSLTGYFGFSFNKFIQRPIIRIEHIDIKSERINFSMDENLWWYLTHNALDDILKDELKNSLQKNEFQYYHLRGLSDSVSQLIKRYSSTASWTRNLLSMLSEYQQNPENDRREELFSQLTPSIAKLEDHYRETTQNNLFADLKDNKDSACEFLQSEIYGMLISHERDLKHFNQCLSWINNNLKSGENPPKPIDHSLGKVPNVSVLVGATNIGETSALLKSEAVLLLDNKRIPLIRKSSLNTRAYFVIEPNSVNGIHVVLDNDACAFDDQVYFYETLTKKQEKKKINVNLKFADGSIIKSSQFDLEDDSSLLV